MEREKQLLIYLSRVSFTDEDEKRILSLLSENINWFEFFKYALYHKTAVLCWKNLRTISPHVFIPKYLDDMMNYCYLSTKMRNRLCLKEAHRVVENLDKNGVISIPVKGTFLLENIYKDFGVRYSGDSDFLVRKADVENLERILTNMGYVMGHYSYSQKRIDPIKRRELLKWKLYMSNLCPFLRLSGSDLFPTYKLDFRHSLDDKLDENPINEIIENYKNTGVVESCYYFLHLCTHFYDEAKHSVDIELYKDLNIIKLCDIREFYLKYMCERELKKFYDFVNKYHFEEQVYFTMMFLKLIYNDGYENEILNNIVCENKNTINTFGDNSLENQESSRKDIMERLFSCGNIDDLQSTSKLGVKKDNRN